MRRFSKMFEDQLAPITRMSKMFEGQLAPTIRMSKVFQDVMRPRIPPDTFRLFRRAEESFRLLRGLDFSEVLRRASPPNCDFGDDLPPLDDIAAVIKEDGIPLA